MTQSENQFSLARAASSKSGRAKSKSLSAAVAGLLCVMIAGLAHIAGNSAIAANDDYLKMKYGIFVHYVWGGSAYTVTVNKDGSKPAGLQDVADRFDAVGFANDVKAMGVEYVIFTAWHANMNVLYPSAKMDQWITFRDKTATRDLIQDLIHALKPTGIELFLYTHPSDGHDFPADEQAATGWNDATNSYKKWNDFINDIYGEVCQRYGTNIAGYWIDSPSAKTDTKRLRATIKACDPNKLIMSNDPFGVDKTLYDLYSWETYVGKEENKWQARADQISLCEGPNWWTTTAYGASQPQHSAEAMFKFTILNAGANTKGMGLSWAAGPYPGGGWETNVKENLQKLGSYIAPIASAIKGVYSSVSYPTAAGATLNSISWGVATESTDRLTEYIHVLKPPTNTTLNLPVPADNKTFTSATMLVSGRAATLVQNATGVHITVPEAWDPLNTVIKLTVGSPAQR